MSSPRLTSNFPLPVVWMIDDDDLFARDVFHYWKHLAPRTFIFHHFLTSSEAWNTWERGTCGQNPCAIVIDGHLKNDDGELASGAGVIRRFRVGNASTRPYLVAFSGDPYALEEMRLAGSDAEFEKGQVKAVLDYLMSRKLHVQKGVLM